MERLRGALEEGHRLREGLQRVRELVHSLDLQGGHLLVHQGPITITITVTVTIIYIYIYIHVCMYVCMYIYIYIYIGTSRG